MYCVPLSWSNGVPLQKKAGRGQARLGEGPDCALQVAVCFLRELASFSGWERATCSCSGPRALKHPASIPLLLIGLRWVT